LRLRDLAGLIVIDFIDMEDSRNDRAVEKRLHNAVKNDRARIQIGKISQFGLLEMSRQRLRAGVIAGSTIPCPHCGGQGIVRSVESTSLRVLRNLEEEAQKQRCDAMVVRVAADVAIYTLNQKRRELARLESEYDVTVTFEPKEHLKAGDFEIDRIGQRDPSTRPKIAAIEAPAAPPAEPEPDVEAEEEEVAAGAPETAPGASQSQPQGEGGGRRRRRRRRRGGRDRGFDQPREQAMRAAPSPASDLSIPNDRAPAPEADVPAEGVGEERPLQAAEPGQPGEGGGRRRRRRRRRGRRGGRDRDLAPGEQQRPDADEPAPAPVFYEDRFGTVDEIDTTPKEESRQPPAAPEAPEAVPNAASTPVWSLENEAAASVREEPPRRVRETPGPGADEPEVAPPQPARREQAAQPVKKGWWQRAFRSD